MEKDNDWFESWFNSDYYHLLYKNRSQNEANLFIENLIQSFSLSKKNKILDLGCGKGRHAYKMSQYFEHVDGLDLSEKNIEKAKKFVAPNLKFQIGDMRNFNLSNRYNYIFNLFTSFGYFKNINQNIDVLKCCHSHLYKNGFLLIDYLNSEQISNQSMKEEIKKINGIIFKTKKTIENNFVIKNISIFDKAKEHNYCEKVQLFDKEQFKEMLKESGFNLMSYFGNYQLNEFNKNSERLIMWAKKI
tara:strand:- start:22298 stop:23032 length:735 start_codon:yes stop_codon:yes gene_type:complete